MGCGLDKKLAQRKHFPSVNWNISFSKYIRILEPYFEKYDAEYSMLQQKMKEILQKEDDLQEIVQLVGKDSLSEDQKCTLEVAKIIREDFLQQNGFTEYDFMCPLAKTIGMMKVIVGFHDAAQKTMSEFTGDQKITWGTINTAMKDHIHEVRVAAPARGVLQEDFCSVARRGGECIQGPRRRRAVSSDCSMFGFCSRRAAFLRSMCFCAKK